MVRGAATTPGHALSQAHKRKLDKSWEPCHAQGIAFLPIAAESLGAWHSSAIAEVKRLGSALARHTGEEEGITIARLFQKLSVCLMRGNAAGTRGVQKIQKLSETPATVHRVAKLCINDSKNKKKHEKLVQPVAPHLCMNPKPQKWPISKMSQTY